MPTADNRHNHKQQATPRVADRMGQLVEINGFHAPTLLDDGAVMDCANVVEGENPLAHFFFISIVEQ